MTTPALYNSKKSFRIIFWSGLIPCLLLSPLWGMGIKLGYLLFSTGFGQSLIIVLMGFAGLSGTIAYILILRRIKCHEPYTHIEYIFAFCGLAGLIAAIIFFSYMTTSSFSYNMSSGVIMILVSAMLSQYIALTEVWKYRTYRTITQ